MGDGIADADFPQADQPVRCDRGNIEFGAVGRVVVHDQMAADAMQYFADAADGYVFDPDARVDMDTLISM